MIFIFFYMTLFTVTLISDTILTFFEIWILKTSYEVENFKYVKLLKWHKKVRDTLRRLQK